jgi:glyoxylate utilization-related uncharacterized protein
MKKKAFTILAIAAFALTGAVLSAAGAGTAVVANADLKWNEMGIPGVVSAPVSGDMAKGPSRFFLKYPAGFVTPKHHHTADHYVAMVSGTITLTVDGKEHKLGPGSYFALTGHATHVARVEGKEDAVMFIQADGAWDVVAEK